MWILFSSFALVVFMGVLIAAGITATGYTIDMAVMHFLLFYAGVFALIGLTTAVGVGLLASDRIVMTPSGRIIAQAVHRAVSFGAVGFLLIHIVTEIIAGRSQAADAVVPFLDQGRTLYLGLGTIASDLFLLILVTGILRARFASVRPTWAWRALHSAAYLAWVLGIVHGLLAGRTAKPYVDWSYGACVAAVGLALIVRVVAAGRVRETASSPVPEAPPWLTAGGGASPWMPGATVSMLDQAPAPARAVSRRPPRTLPAAPPRALPAAPPRALPAAPPRAIPASPEPAGGARQYPERATGSRQYPDQATGPHQHPQRTTGARRYPERATGPQQYPERAAGPQQYPERAAGPQQYPERAAGPQQYPGRATGPNQYPGRATGPNQYPGRATGPQQYPGRATGPHQYPGPAAPDPQYAAGVPQYPGPGDTAGYYQEPDDGDYDPEWADAEDLDAGDYDVEPHAGDYDFEPHAGDYDAEWADAGDYGPGPGPHPGRPYPPGGTSHLGWTR
jgi:hypothetical protein